MFVVVVLSVVEGAAVGVGKAANNAKLLLLIGMEHTHTHTYRRLSASLNLCLSVCVCVSLMQLQQLQLQLRAQVEWGKNGHGDGRPGVARLRLVLFRLVFFTCMKIDTQIKY